MSAGAIAVVGVIVVFLTLLVLSEIIRLISLFFGVRSDSPSAVDSADDSRIRHLSRQAADIAMISAVFHSRGIHGALTIRRVEED